MSYNSIYIYHHLGLGDCIACNGIVRSYAKQYDKVFVFSKPSNASKLIYMYRDLYNIRIISLEDNEVKNFMSINPNNKYLVVGHKALYDELVKDPDGRFDQIFYKMAGLPFESKWNKFKLERNYQRELEVFDMLKISEGEKYAFVHDDYSRDLKITKNFPDIRVIRPERKDISIFDFLGVIEKASEVHCIDSSFMNLIDCIQLRQDNLYFHKYVKIHLVGEGGTPTLKLPWKIIE